MSARNITSDRKRSRPVTKRRRIENKYVIGIIVVIVAIVVIVSIYVFVGNGINDAFQDIFNEPTNDENNVTVGNPIAVIDTSKGTIRVELYSDKVPNTCENFIKLANDGFYSGLVFHRVANLITGEPETHIIQGGGFDDDGNHKESPYGPIDLEIHPDVRHVDGAIAMARTTDPNSATSQFYICDGEHSFLNDNYAAFGVVVEGMSVVRAIALEDTTTKYGMQNWPIENIIINSITIENQ